MQSFLEKLAANLVIAAFVPSLAFATIILLFFIPMLPQTTLMEVDKLAVELSASRRQIKTPP